MIFLRAKVHAFRFDDKPQLRQYRQWLEECWQRTSRENPDQRLLARIADEIETADIALEVEHSSRRDAA